jgi:hypothetical protein
MKWFLKACIFREGDDNVNKQDWHFVSSWYYLRRDVDLGGPSSRAAGGSQETGKTLVSAACAYPFRRSRLGWSPQPTRSSSW